jgi:FkbM family methyltransferase
VSAEPLDTLRASLERSLDTPRAFPAGAWIFGAGGFAKALRLALEAAGVRVHGYLTTTDTGKIDDLPVRQVRVGPSGVEAIFIGVFNHRADSDYRELSILLRHIGFPKPYWPQESYELLADALGWRYWLTPRSFYLDNWSNIADAYSILGDPTSREHYLDLLKFRISAFESPPCPCAETQYFPARLLSALPPKCVWADGGAFVGDTLITSQAHFHTDLCFAFEPDPDAYANLVTNTYSLVFPVIRLPLGLAERNATLPFRTGTSGSGSVDSTGNTRLSFGKLDDLLHHRPIDFLKLDVEGQEIAALRGAERIIRGTRPVLAIAAYHRWNDIPDIIGLLRSYRDDYQFFLRVHEHNSFDTVLYAV